jgi:hypothetical protein
MRVFPERNHETKYPVAVSILAFEIPHVFEES